MQSSKEFDAKVYYQQLGANDSPWSPPARFLHERFLRGWGFDAGQVRIQFNRDLPQGEEADLWVVNASLTSPAAQWFMRYGLRGRRWLFWGEPLRRSAGLKAMAQKVLTGGLQTAHGIVAIGSEAVRDYRLRVPMKPIWNIPYHCDIESFQAPLRSYHANGMTTFLFCGQMIDRKGIDVLLEAFALICDRGIEARLLLIGREGILQKCLLKLSVEIAAKIEYVGFKQPHELPLLFLRADVLVLPSRHEGWGVVVNQALAAGLSVICSDAVGAGNDMVVPGVNGLVVEAGNTMALAEMMDRLACDRPLVLKWGNQSRHFSHQWTPEAGVRKWEAVVEEVFQQT